MQAARQPPPSLPPLDRPAGSGRVAVACYHTIRWTAALWISPGRSSGCPGRLAVELGEGWPAGAGLRYRSVDAEDNGPPGVPATAFPVKAPTRASLAVMQAAPVGLLSPSPTGAHLRSLLRPPATVPAAPPTSRADSFPSCAPFGTRRQHGEAGRALQCQSASPGSCVGAARPLRGSSRRLPPPLALPCRPTAFHWPARCAGSPHDSADAAHNQQEQPHVFRLVSGGRRSPEHCWPVAASRGALPPAHCFVHRPLPAALLPLQ